MNIRVGIGYKFILGFITVVATAAFAPWFINRVEMAEWMREPISMLTAILIGLVLGSLFTRWLTRDFHHLAAIANEISHGDLTQREVVIKKTFQDETIELAEALDKMLKGLKALVGHIKETSTRLAETSGGLHGVASTGYNTAEEIARGTSKIFEGALEQANNVEEASRVIKEMAQSAGEVARSEMDTANWTSRTTANVKKGTATATSAIEKMETVFKQIEASRDTIIGLEDRVNHIPKILDVITHISRQTDLLALNATIEASKAGEYGRGFALVAEEVRRLADNTNRSIDDVAIVVKDIKGEMERVADSSREVTSFIKEGREDIRHIREFLEEIDTFTAEVTGKVNTILALTQGQREGAETTVKAVEEIDRIAKASVAVTEEVDNLVDNHRMAMKDVMGSSERLSGLSKELNRVVAGFKLEREERSEGGLPPSETTPLFEKGGI